MSSKNKKILLSISDIASLFAILSLEYIIISYFFGITNRNMLPNYVSDFLLIQSFVDSSMYSTVIFIILGSLMSIVLCSFRRYIVAVKYLSPLYLKSIINKNKKIKITICIFTIIISIIIGKYADAIAIAIAFLLSYI